MTGLPPTRASKSSERLPDARPVVDGAFEQAEVVADAHEQPRVPPSTMTGSARKMASTACRSRPRSLQVGAARPSRSAQVVGAGGRTSSASPSIASSGTGRPASIIQVSLRWLLAMSAALLAAAWRRRLDAAEQ